MAITAAQINELRKATGAGMLDCKKALEQTEGDYEKAVDYLRTKGLAAAAKKSGRAATEGMVAAFVSDDLKSGVLLEINSETDFVAKNEIFQAFVANIGKHILATSPADRDTMLAQSYSGDSAKTVQTYLNESISVIGENIQIRRFAKFDVQGDGCIGSYIHGGGKIGVLVQIASPVVVHLRDTIPIVHIKGSSSTDLPAPLTPPPVIQTTLINLSSRRRDHAVVRRRRGTTLNHHRHWALNVQC